MYCCLYYLYRRRAPITLWPPCPTSTPPAGHFPHNFALTYHNTTNVFVALYYCLLYVCTANKNIKTAEYCRSTAAAVNDRRHLSPSHEVIPCCVSLAAVRRRWTRTRESSVILLASRVYTAIRSRNMKYSPRAYFLLLLLWYHMLQLRVSTVQRSRCSLPQKTQVFCILVHCQK